MPNQQLCQPISGEYKRTINQQISTLSTGVSFQFLGRKIEVVSLHDSAV
jgi:hypothetical protein